MDNGKGQLGFGGVRCTQAKKSAQLARDRRGAIGTPVEDGGGGTGALSQPGPTVLSLGTRYQNAKAPQLQCLDGAVGRASSTRSKSQPSRDREMLGGFAQAEPESSISACFSRSTKLRTKPRRDHAPLQVTRPPRIIRGDFMIFEESSSSSWRLFLGVRFHSGHDTLMISRALLIINKHTCS